MGYLEKTSIPGETVAYRAHLHWIIYKWAVLLTLLGVGLALIPEVRPVGLVALALAVVFGIGSGVNQASAEFAVTNKRVVLKTGLVRRHTHELFLAKVESLRIEQSIMGRILNYGELRVEGTGSSDTRFPYIAKPLEFRRAINQQVAG